MPTKIKLLLSLIVLAVGAGAYHYEQTLGNIDLSYIAGGLAIFMVLAIWLFPETSGD